MSTRSEVTYENGKALVGGEVETKTNKRRRIPLKRMKFQPAWDLLDNENRAGDRPYIEEILRIAPEAAVYFGPKKRWKDRVLKSDKLIWGAEFLVGGRKTVVVKLDSGVFSQSGAVRYDVVRVLQRSQDDTGTFFSTELAKGYFNELLYKEVRSKN